MAVFPLLSFELHWTASLNSWLCFLGRFGVEFCKSCLGKTQGHHKHARGVISQRKAEMVCSHSTFSWSNSFKEFLYQHQWVRTADQHTNCFHCFNTRVRTHLHTTTVFEACGKPYELISREQAPMNQRFCPCNNCDFFVPSWFSSAM